MKIRRAVADKTRPLRRRLRPWSFKESYLNHILAAFSPSLYVEIGVRWGESLRNVRADRKVGVDPVRHPALNVLRSGEEFYEMTSDVFFEEVAPIAVPVGGVHAALVDGLHEFRQALNDVLNLEPYMAVDGLIVVDDCNPPAADLAVDERTGGAWNGDVWKVAEFLRHERPSLRFVTAAADQGVGLLSGFSAPTLARPSGATIAEYKALPYSYLEQHRSEVLSLVAPGPGAFTSQ